MQNPVPSPHGDPGAAPSRPLHEHEPALRRFFEEGRAEYGALPLGFEAFAGRVLALTARRLAGVPALEARVRQALQTVAGRDLYLAIACDLGVPGSWETLSRRFLPRLKALLRRRGSSAREAEELTRELPGDLVAPPASRRDRTTIGSFDGTGTLFFWMAGVVLRRRAQRARSHAAAPPEAEGGAPAYPPVASGPVELAEHAEFVALFARDFERAWRALTSRETLALLYKYRDGLPQTVIARLLGIGEPRVSRLIAKALTRLRHSLERVWSERSPGPGAGPWSSLRQVVERRLATYGAPSNPPA
jgi:DNA-directed RNA polymerase specialized sigma24 family protein